MPADLMQNQIHLVKLLIEKSGLSQKKIAELVGTTDNKVSNYKLGRVPITLNRFLAWCEILEVDVEELFKN